MSYNKPHAAAPDNDEATHCRICNLSVGHPIHQGAQLDPPYDRPPYDRPPLDPPHFLRAGIGTFNSRNTIYKDNYKQLGRVMSALFPNGITLRTNADWNRFGLLISAMTKMTRYCENWASGGHPDSMHDLMVYAAMMQELDALEKQA